MRARITCASRYAVGEELGVGGMGVVRAAVDQRLGREVAIKTLRASSRPRRPLERRFLREAAVQASLEHSAILPVYDIGRDAEGALFFSMKRVVGTTFDVLIARDAGQLLEAFVHACRAVEHAHRRGVVHRDLKPSNVMLSEDGQVYVLDWGVAALLNIPDIVVLPAGADARDHTPDGETVGTPGYLSPEQARGGLVDARADIYALGAMLFELLSLEPLHPRGPTEKILLSTLSGPDARPSRRAPERDIGRELDAICVRATALEPDDRYQTVSELIEALEPLLARAEVEPSPRKKRSRAAAVAVCAVMALLACVLFAAPEREARSRPHVARLDHWPASLRMRTRDVAP